MNEKFDIKEILKELKELEIKRHFLNVNEVATLFGVHPLTVKKWIDNKVILGIKLYEPEKKKYKYFVPVWAFKDLLSKENYKVFLLCLKTFLENKKSHKKFIQSKL